MKLLNFVLSGLIVEELKEESYKYEACLHNEGARNNSKYPENYETCMNFAGVLRSFFQVLSKWILWNLYVPKPLYHKSNLVSWFPANTRGNQNWMLCSLLRANGGNKNGKNAADDEENPQQRSSSVISNPHNLLWEIFSWNITYQIPLWKTQFFLQVIN